MTKEAKMMKMRIWTKMRKETKMTKMRIWTIESGTVFSRGFLCVVFFLRQGFQGVGYRPEGGINSLVVSSHFCVPCTYHCPSHKLVLGGAEQFS